MINIKKEKIEIIKNVAKEVAKLERGKWVAHKTEAEEIKRLVSIYSSTDTKDMNDYLNKEIEVLAGYLERYGFGKYWNSYEVVYTFKGKVKNVTDNFIIFENCRIKKERLYAVVK